MTPIKNTFSKHKLLLIIPLAINKDDTNRGGSRNSEREAQNKFDTNNYI